MRAGGTVLLASCETIPGSGNIPFDPSVSVFYTADRKRMDLELRTEGLCDTVLLVRTPSGRWFFDDDNGPERNARLRLSTPPEGRYEIWVGSQGGSACTSRLALQTFRANVKLARDDRSGTRARAASSGRNKALPNWLTGPYSGASLATTRDRSKACAVRSAATSTPR